MCYMNGIWNRLGKEPKGGKENGKKQRNFGHSRNDLKRTKIIKSYESDCEANMFQKRLFFFGYLKIII